MHTKATFRLLGCGTSTGVPLPGCKCKVCKSEDPRNRRLRCSAWMRDSHGKSVLIDAGPDLRTQALAYDIDRLDAVLFTHAHADHILGFDDLRAFNFINRAPVPCYADQATWAAIKKIFHYIIDPVADYKGGEVTKVAINYIEAFKEFNVEGIKVLPFELLHGDLPVLGFKIGNLAYATDCNCVPPASRELLRGIDYLIIDGLRFEPHPTHFTIPQAIELAQQLEVKQTYLTHLTHTVSYAEVSQTLPDGINLGFDGLELAIDL